MAVPMNISAPTSDVCKITRRFDTETSLTTDGAADIEHLVHPLVVINISDHFNRFAAMRFHPRGSASAMLETPPPPMLYDPTGSIRVIGLLLGDQHGCRIDICHSFELPAEHARDGAVEVDAEFLQARIEQYRQIFPHYHVVGWYSTGSSITEDDVRLHREVFSALNESPLFMVINTEACMTSLAVRLHGATLVQPSAHVLDEPGAPRTLDAMKSPAQHSVTAETECHVKAITIYQAELHMTDAGPRTKLMEVPHRYASADSERIAVDHITRHAVPGGSDGVATQHLSTLRQSVQMLSARIDVLLRFLDETTAGKLDVDHAVLRKVAGVCARMPAMETDDLLNAFDQEHYDSTVVNFLCGVTKSLCAMNGLVDSFHVAYEKSSSAVSRRRP